LIHFALIHVALIHVALIHVALIHFALQSEKKLKKVKRKDKNF